MPEVIEQIRRFHMARRAFVNRARFQLNRLVGQNDLALLRVPSWGLRTTLDINPAWICHSIARENRDFALGRLFQDGDWDMKLTNGRVTDTMKYTTIGQILDGCPVEETVEFKTYRARKKAEAASGVPHKGPHNYSRKRLVEYMTGLASMYRTVAAEGEFDQKLMLESPIKVGITRTGDLVKLSDGNHRLALAHYAGIRRMPVQLRVIHFAKIGEIALRGKPLEDLASYIDDLERTFQQECPKQAKVTDQSKGE